MAVPHADYAPPPLTMRVHHHPGAMSVVAVCGEIDPDSAPQLEQTVSDVLSSDEVRCLVLDLAEVDFCGAAGVRALLNCQAQAQRLDVPMEIRRVPAPVRRVLAACMVTDILGLSAA